LETIIGWDEQIFYWINHGWSGTLGDYVFPFLRERNNWIPLYLLLIALVLYRYRWSGTTFILVAVLTAGTADIVNSRFIKPSVERLRPCRQEQMDAVVRAPCGSGYSFASSHAANHFAVATFFALTLGRVWRWSRPLWWLWATSIALGQVYVGVHFPFDIFFGGMLGILIGWIGYQIYRRTRPIQELVSS
jgi:membrane-associated phospholipid phosphatase